MITLLTGAPGAGKTSQLVEWLRTLYADRPIYVHGLNGLTLPHQVVDASQWHNDVPDGAILVIDEVQQVWRPRGPGHAVPDSVKALETHRHRGIDIFLTTQKPNLLDVNVRGLVGRHVHIRDTGWLGRWVYEWPECSENLAWKTCPVKRRFNLPKASFGLYKSAVEHTTVGKTRSLMPLITAGLVVLSIGLVYAVYKVVSRKTSPVAPVEAVQAAPAGGSVHSVAPPAAAASSARDRWPVYEASAPVLEPDPYHGRALQLEGQFIQAGKPWAYFGLLIDGQRVATVSLAQLVKMGYSYTDLGPCAAILSFGDRQRLLTCAKRHDVEQRPSAPLVADASPLASIVPASIAGAVGVR